VGKAAVLIGIIEIEALIIGTLKARWNYRTAGPVSRLLLRGRNE